MRVCATFFMPLCYAKTDIYTKVWPNACSAIWVIRKLAKILWRCEYVKKIYTSIIEIKY